MSYRASSFFILCHSARWFSHRVSLLSCMLRYYRDHYSYWFFLLYCSVISRSFLNFSTLSGFIFPAFIALRFAFNQFKWSCSSIRCREGFRLFVSINVITSLYRIFQRSSCVISHFLVIFNRIYLLRNYHLPVFSNF